MRTLVAVLLLVAPVATDAQSRTREMSIRELHARVVHNLVQIQGRNGAGSGWLLAQSGRPLVVTNRHVVERAGRPFEVAFYQGSGRAPIVIRASVFARSDDVDLALLRLAEDPPESAQPHRLRASTTVYRGERIVLGGNPSAGSGQLPFQTTFGVVTGHVSGRAFAPCGAGRNCVVVDAASLGGSSGGPAFNLRGELVGMLWGGPVQAAQIVTEAGRAPAAALVQSASFAYLIHTRTLADELRRFERNSR